MVVSSKLIGKPVHHPLFGEGIIEGVRWRDSFVLVRFGPKHTMWLPSEQMKLGRRTDDRPLRKIKAPPVAASDQDRLPSRRMIEAFRHGIVPHGDIGRFTFGRGKETKELDRAFQSVEERGGSPLIVEGPYGSGKTHFMDFVEATAIQRGFAVAKAALDPWEVTPARPLRVYCELAASFHYQGGGFHEFLREASAVQPDPPHAFLTPALRKIRRGKADHLLWEWISGERNPRFYLNEFGSYWNLPVMLTHSTAADIYAYILSGLGWLSGQIGLRGLVLLFDEAESVFRLTLDRDKAFGFLRGLIHVSLNTPELLSGQGGRTLGLFHSGVRTTPYIYQIPTRVICVLALTPVWSVVYHDLKTLAENRVITLSALTSEDYLQMFERLSVLYKSAYPEMEFDWDLDHVFRLLINRRDEGIRFFIKSAVEAMDLVRHHSATECAQILKYEYT